MSLVPSSSRGSGGGLPSQWTDGGHGNVTASVDTTTAVPFTIAPPDSSGARDGHLVLVTAEAVGTGACVFEVKQSAGRGGDPVFEQYDTGEVDIHVVDDAPAIKITDSFTGATGTNLIQATGGTGRLADVLFLSGAPGGAEVRFGVAGFRVARLVAAPADVDIGTSGFALWLDATPGVGNTKLMIKAKDSAGTVRQAAVVLA